MLCNDVTAMYYNARSLIPKYDELCVTMEVQNPDMVYAMWKLGYVLMYSIVKLPYLDSYQVYRRDRNRHGGGIPIYVRDQFVCNILPSADNLETITVSVCHGPSKFFLSLFYQPPNSLSQVFEDLFLYLHSLDVGSFCNYILLGDFNVNFCNQSHPFYSKLYSIFESFCLTDCL